MAESTSIIEDIQNFLQGIYNTVANYISDLVNEAIKSVVEVVDIIQETIIALVDNAADAITNLAETALRVLDDTLDSMREFVTNTYRTISDAITNTLDKATTFLTNIYNDAVDLIVDTASRAGDFLTDLYDTLSIKVNQLLDDASFVLETLVDTVTAKIGGLVDSVKLYVGDLFDRVKAGVSAIIDQAQDLYRAVESSIGEFITATLDPVEGVITNLLETISDLPGEVSALAERLVQSAADNIGVPITDIPKSMIDELTKRLSADSVKDVDRLKVDTLALVLGRSPVIRSRAELREMIDNILPDNAYLKSAMIGILAPVMLATVLMSMAKANSEILLQEHAMENPYRLLEPPDIAKAYHYRLYNQDHAVEELRRWGYDSAQASDLLEMSFTPPPIGELVSWRLRGIINEDDFNEDVKRQGWKPKDIERLKEASFFVPPVQDLITMSVREVFSPEVAEQFGQFDDYPPRFTQEAAKQGVSEEWARNYWAAHWSLPSPNMGFEMLHRGVIDETQLDMLLRALDVMPFWRDKLTQISYSPLTRVDVRRMHKLGVLSDDEVLKAYKDIGYNQENAERLLQFTKEYNGAGDVEADIEAAGLTRSAIIQFYRDGTLDRSTAFDLLTAVGVSEDSAELFLMSADLQNEAELRKAEIALVLDKASAGVLDFNGAQDALSLLGLEETEKLKALTQLEAIITKRSKIPSKADLDKFLTKSLITQSEYSESMRLHGYSDKWINLYIQSLTGKKANG